MRPSEESFPQDDQRLSTDDLAGAGVSPAGVVPPGADEEELVALLPPEQAERFRTQWRDIQSGFVDDPRDAVHAADQLVAEVMQVLASSFADHKRNLVEQWDRAGQIETEQLRLALRQYRSFFNRLLTT